MEWGHTQRRDLMERGTGNGTQIERGYKWNGDTNEDGIHTKRG